MVVVLAMMRLRHLLPALVGVALSGCSSDSNTVYEQLGPLLQQELFGGAIFGGEETPAAEPHEMTRAELNQIPYATIGLRVGDGARAFVVPLANNEGSLVYEDPARRGIVMQGGLVTGTHGLGNDLDAVAHRVDDPVVVPTPVPDWPAEVERSYGFTVRGLQPYEIAVTCTYQRGVREFVDIVELRFEVVRIVETCRNPRRTFTNTYWAAPNTGFIWKSVQWVGPRLSPLTVEIVRPYGRS